MFLELLLFLCTSYIWLKTVCESLFIVIDDDDDGGGGTAADNNNNKLLITVI